MRLSYLFLCGCLSLFSHPTFADTAPSVSEKESHKEGAITFLLPVNWTTDDLTNLVIKLPEEFRNIQPLSEWNKPETVIIEFIPKSDSEDEWKQIITLTKYVGQKIDAKQVTDLLKEGLLAETKNGTVLQEETKKEDAYQRASLALSYDYEGYHELLGALYYSGPLDCAGVQYTIRAKKDQNDKDTLKIINDFFDKNVEIVSTPKEDEEEDHS